MRDLAAELVYVFRHALLRDAAVEVQLPGDRARLHAIAFTVIERLFGGRAPEPDPNSVDDRSLERHPTDSVAEELAAHASAARQTGLLDAASVRAGRMYLFRAAFVATREYRRMDAVRLHLAAADHPDQPAEIRIMHLAWGALEALKVGLALQAQDLIQRAVDASRSFRGTEAEAAALMAESTVLKDSAQGREPEAEKSIRRALEIFRKSGNRRREGSACGNLAALLQQMGRIEEAERLSREALGIHRAAGNPNGECYVTCNLASLVCQAGRLDEAESLVLRAIELCRLTGNGLTQTSAHATEGHILLSRGRLHEAGTAFGKALELARSAGTRIMEGVSLSGLGNISARLGRPGEAEPHLRQALAVFTELGNRRAMASGLLNLAIALEAQGRVSEALELNRRSLALMKETNNREHAAVVQMNIAFNLERLGRWSEAKETCGEALRHFRLAGSAHFEAKSLSCLAEIAAAEGDDAGSIANYEEAIRIHRRNPPGAPLAEDLCSLALCLVRIGKRDLALAAWREGEAILSGSEYRERLSDLRAAMRSTCARVGSPPLEEPVS